MFYNPVQNYKINLPNNWYLATSRDFGRDLLFAQSFEPHKPGQVFQFSDGPGAREPDFSFYINISKKGINSGMPSGFFGNEVKGYLFINGYKAQLLSFPDATGENTLVLSYIFETEDNTVDISLADRKENNFDKTRKLLDQIASFFHFVEPKKIQGTNSEKIPSYVPLCGTSNVQGVSSYKYSILFPDGWNEYDKAGGGKKIYVKYSNKRTDTCEKPPMNKDNFDKFDQVLSFQYNDNSRVEGLSLADNLKNIYNTGVVDNLIINGKNAVLFSFYNSVDEGGALVVGYLIENGDDLIYISLENRKSDDFGESVKELDKLMEGVKFVSK
jgi:hypothetical protein